MGFCFFWAWVAWVGVCEGWWMLFRGLERFGGCEVWLSAWIYIWPFLGFGVCLVYIRFPFVIYSNLIPFGIYKLDFYELLFSFVVIFVYVHGMHFSLFSSFLNCFLDQARYAWMLLIRLGRQCMI
jgi:hypothetical protein